MSDDYDFVKAWREHQADLRADRRMLFGFVAGVFSATATIIILLFCYVVWGV